MIKLSWYTILCLTLFGCAKPDIEKPTWLNSKTNVHIPTDTLFFKVKGNSWNANLQSFVQPIILKKTYTKDRLILTFQKSSGIIEGPGILTLSKNDQNFHFDLSLINKNTPHIIKKDYRSPKTVNPDSSLEQHRLKHHIGTWRNIAPLDFKDSFFKEDIIYLSPKVATYQAQKAKPLTSFYVQAGSCTNVPLNYKYDPINKWFEVNVGPLRDKHGNTVSDGTEVNFIYSCDKKTYRRETHLLNGYTKTHISEISNETISLQVKVNETSSAKIKLIAF